jgi:hypothetical protein
MEYYIGGNKFMANLEILEPGLAEKLGANEANMTDYLFIHGLLLTESLTVMLEPVEEMMSRKWLPSPRCWIEVQNAKFLRGIT